MTRRSNGSKRPANALRVNGMAGGSGTMFGNTMPGRKTARRLLCTLTHPQNPGQQWACAGMTIQDCHRGPIPSTCRSSSWRWLMGKLEGKVALVTGSGRNIGRATVLQLAGEGAHVVVNARANQQEAESVAREARDLGVKALPVLADVGKKDEVEALAQKALAEFGRVDILINNAAIRPHKPFLELTDEDYERVRSVVLDGAFWLTRAIIPSMVKNKYGQILFFVGDGAFSGRGSGRAHLSAAKMGLIGMARGLASEFAPHNIRVNVVSPGSIDTRRDNPEWYANRPPDAVGIPLGRQGHVDEIAATCLFLVSEDAGFITGQTIRVNGGAHYY